MTERAAQRILLVEDDMDQAELFAQALRMDGYTVEMVPEAEAALAALRVQPFDLVLLDWDLPGITGDAFILFLKVEYPQTRTMLFSNHPEIAQAALISGADAWLLKSEGIHRLRALIDALLRPRGPQAA